MTTDPHLNASANPSTSSALQALPHTQTSLSECKEVDLDWVALLGAQLKAKRDAGQRQIAE